MTYEQMEQELNQIPMFGESGGSPEDRLSPYLNHLNHPENSLRVIHVAGTNGKGSVSAYIESILREAGYTTGLFISPHLIRINERIRLNFVPCQDQEMADAYGRLKNLMERRDELGLKRLTYFEVLFLMSLLVFHKRKPDYCIVETGLGGRLDATMMTKPILSVITSISLDHTAILGDTVEEIAMEKAGIIREGIPVVVMREAKGAFEVIASVAKTKGAPVYDVSAQDAVKFKKIGNSIDFCMENRYYKNGHLRINSIASYQKNNAMLAALAAHLLPISLSDEQIGQGIASMRWEGRMEQIQPGLYVDGAHNPGAIEQIKQTVSEDGRTWSLLFAVCQDKDYHQMISSLGQVEWKKVIVTNFYNDRAADTAEIASEWEKCVNCSVSVCEDLRQALDNLEEEKNRPVLCLGSLYLVGEIKAYYDGMSESEGTK